MKILRTLCAYYQTQTVLKLLYSQAIFTPITGLMFMSLANNKEIIEAQINDKRRIQAYNSKILPLATFCTILNAILGLLFLAFVFAPISYYAPYVIRNFIMLLNFLELYCLIRLNAEEAAVTHSIYATFTLTICAYAELEHAFAITIITTLVSIIVTNILLTKSKNTIAHDCFGVRSISDLKDNPENSANTTETVINLNETT